MTLKAGTVCWLRVPLTSHHKELIGRVVTLTGGREPTRHGVAYEFTPMLFTRRREPISYALRRSLVPISDPDQPVDVTSDTDEPVTA